MAQGDSAVEYRVLRTDPLQRDIVSITSVRQAREMVELGPRDLVFCETHPALALWVRELRATEAVLQTGVFPLEAQGNSDWPTEEITVCAQFLLDASGVDAVPIILGQAYETALQFDTKRGQGPGIGYMGMVDAYLGMCLGAGEASENPAYHKEIERALQPLLYKRGGGLGELYASRFLTYKGYEGNLNMRVNDRPLESGRDFEYYAFTR